MEDEPFIVLANSWQFLCALTPTSLKQYSQIWLLPQAWTGMDLSALPKAVGVGQMIVRLTQISNNSNHRAPSPHAYSNEAEMWLTFFSQQGTTHSDSAMQPQNRKLNLK